VSHRSQGALQKKPIASLSQVVVLLCANRFSCRGARILFVCLVRHAVSLGRVREDEALAVCRG
jgi:hypothetical protein